VWEEETAHHSTPTQSTPTQHAGNIGAQPKDGMRGRRLYEVAASAHRPCYMDVEYTCTDRVETCVRACTHPNTHSLPISALYSIWPASWILP